MQGHTVLPGARIPTYALRCMELQWGFAKLKGVNCPDLTRGHLPPPPLQGVHCPRPAHRQPTFSTEQQHHGAARCYHDLPRGHHVGPARVGSIRRGRCTQGACMCVLHAWAKQSGQAADLVSSYSDTG